MYTTIQKFVYRCHPGGETRFFLLMPGEAEHYRKLIAEGWWSVEKCFEVATGARPEACEIRLVIEYLDKTA